MSAGKYVVPFRQRIVVLIVEILPSQFTIPLPGAVLICQKEVFRDGVGFIPRPALVLVRAPDFSVLHGFLWKMRQRRVSSALKNRQSLGITNIGVRIDQPTNQLVIAVGGETVVFVERSRDRLRIEAVQAQDSVARFGIFRNCVMACQRRYPLTESCRWSKTRIKSVPVVVWIVVIPPP